MMPDPPDTTHPNYRVARTATSRERVSGGRDEHHFFVIFCSIFAACMSKWADRVPGLGSATNDEIFKVTRERRSISEWILDVPLCDCNWYQYATLNDYSRFHLGWLFPGLPLLIPAHLPPSLRSPENTPFQTSHPLCSFVRRGTGRTLHLFRKRMITMA